MSRQPELAELLLEAPLLIVSPHLDDAALSCGALLDRGRPAEVLTVFAGRPVPPRQGVWDLRCGFGSSAESIPARLREDDAAFAGSGHTVRRLELLEEQYLDAPRGDDESDAVAAAVAAWADSVADGVVALPVGAGRSRSSLARLRALALRRDDPPRHPDHVFVRDAGASALHAHARVTPALYEELPYLLGGPGDREAARLARRLDARASEVRLEVAAGAKAARLRAYESQIPHLVFGGRTFDNPEALPPLERYWVLARG